MSTDLEDFMWHARHMSTAEHQDGCDRRLVDWRMKAELWRWWGGDDPGPQPEPCPGCVTDTDRALWARLADEVDAWLGRDEQEGLFESPSVDSDSRGTAVESETKRGSDRANESDPLATVSTRPKGA